MTPAIWIVLVTALATGYSGYMGYSGYETSSETDYTISLALSYAIALWALGDAKKRKYHLPYEFGAFAILFSIITLPVYLFETRRWKGIGIAIALVSTYFVPSIANELAYWAGPESE